MTEIRLTRGYVSLIDTQDLKRVSRYKWYARITKNNVYAGRSSKTVLLHRFILNFPTGFVDHINGNTLDNRRKNLRVATNQQNQANSKPRKHTSKFKGVSRRSNRSAWFAYIKKDRKTKYIGSFSTDIQAAKAYDKEARKLFGKYALLNFGGR